MNYFVVADVHGYYYELINALNEKGFNPEDENHKLIVCGDLMDRGPEAVQLQKYILELMERDKVILIKGNHEDLILDLIINIGFYTFRFRDSHHYSNGTIDTCEQLVKMSDYDVMHNPLKFVTKMVNTPFIKTIIPAMKNYFETEHYIFVHGWIPCMVEKSVYPNNPKATKYKYNADWRSASEEQWEEARWFNGMELAHKHNIKEPGKTIVCGHWHCSWGWAHILQKYKEFPNKSRKNWEKAFEPYTEGGLVALDACTYYSGIINVLVVEDD